MEGGSTKKFARNGATALGAGAPSSAITAGWAAVMGSEESQSQLSSLHFKSRALRSLWQRGATSRQAFWAKKSLTGIYVALQVLFVAFLGEVHADATVTHLHGGSGAIPVCHPERRRAAHCPVRGDFRSARGLTSALPERPGSHPQGPLSTPGSSAPEGLTLAEMCWQLLPLKPVNHHLRREQGTWQNQKQFR